MSKEFEQIKNMISTAKDYCTQQQNNQERQKQTEESLYRSKIASEYAKNMSVLESTGITEIFRGIIENEVVILKPTRIDNVRRKNFWGNFKVYQEYIPQEPAYITTSNKPENNIRLADIERSPKSYTTARITLNFDSHFEEPDANDYDTVGYTTERQLSMTHDGENIRLNCEIIPLNIKKEELIQKIGEEIVRLKGLSLPKSRS